MSLTMASIRIDVPDTPTLTPVLDRCVMGTPAPALIAKEV